MEILFIIGRVLFGGLMVFAGVSHFTQMKKMIGMAKMNKVPIPGLAVAVTGLLLLLGGLSVVVWYEIWWGLVALLVFFVPTTLMMHAFWNAAPEKKTQQMHGFMGNISIIGLLLMLLNFVS